MFELVTRVRICVVGCGCCFSCMSIESALKNIYALCVHYIRWEVIPGGYHTLGEGLHVQQVSAYLFEQLQDMA